MTRARLSTTVDAALLHRARQLEARTDAALVEAALVALLRTHRTAEIDESYRAYDQHPIAEPDAWGDLETFRRAAGAS